MIFKDNKLFGIEIERKEGENVMYINFMGADRVPSLSDDGNVMAQAMESLAENSNVSRIVFVQQRNYNYSSEQVALLSEMARVYNYLIKSEEVLSSEKLSIFGNVQEVQGDLIYLLNTLKKDPIGVYVELKNRIKSLRKQMESGQVINKNALVNYIRFLERFQGLLDGTKMIQRVLPLIIGHVSGDREIYREIFRPDVLPNFTFTRLVATLPKNAELIDQYEIEMEDEKVNVTILKREGEGKHIYHVMPTEYGLSDEQHALVNLARNVLSEHRPKAEEFTDPDKTRQVFFNVARDLITDLSKSKGIKLSYKDLSKLSRVLVRHTIGFGLIEVLLADERLQDVVLNAPIAQNPIFVRHGEFDECVTNIIPSYEDADSWAAKLRLQSGRPLDEANPVLDTDLEFGNTRARVAAVIQPLSPRGLAFAFRRHRDEPWTLPLFIENKMINSLTAGLFSFIIDGSRTLLVAGTRSSGKCVDGNTLIQMSDGGITMIRDLVGEKKKEIEDGIIFSSSKNSGVETLRNYKIEGSGISDVWKRESPEKLIKIRTRSGKEIFTTREHPYFVYSKGMKNRIAEEINKGDLIASPRKLNIFGREMFIDLKDNDYCIGEEEDFFLLRGKTNSLTVRFPKKVTPELAELIGLIVGDGHLDGTKLEFHNSNMGLRKRYSSLIEMFGVPYREFKSHTTSVVQVSSRVLSRVLNGVFEIPLGNKSSKVIIPQIILKSKDEVLASFLRGYFDTDGYVPNEKRDIELATASEEMAKQVQMALLRFGITAFVKFRKVRGFDSYRILIRGRFVRDFAKSIGFGVDYKVKRLEKILDKKYIENTNVDVIPEGNSILMELRKILRISPRQYKGSGKDYWAYENNKYRVSRNWFGKIIDFYKNEYGQIEKMKEQVEILRSFANFDLRDYLSKLEGIRKSLRISYTRLSEETSLSEAGVRKILQNECLGNLDVLKEMDGVANSLIRESGEFSKVNGELNLLSYNHIIGKSVSVGIILSSFRKIFNISNEEFASSGCSLSTVSNLFNGRYNNVKVKVLQMFAGKVVEIYDSIVNENTAKLIGEAHKLANSDIFWDEVEASEEVDKIDEFVYDLTVEETHNFVANGLIAHNTSLLGSLMLEIMPKFRVIVVEDTLEIPVGALRKIGYDILSMKVRSALVEGTSEVEASEGIRTSLRLGDSALIVGEVRSEEAKALYEAMRIGALANVVAGTIHGDSPYGVFDRVVNDLGVERTSFKATDLIIVTNPIKTADGLHSKKRVVKVTEVRKHWTVDPEQEAGFVDLLRYNVETDELEPTEELINGDSEIIKSIAGNVKGWAGNWDAVWDNIILRGKIKQEIVAVAKKLNKKSLMEAKFNSLSNEAFHRISEDVRNDEGKLDSDIIFEKWKEWMLKKAGEF